MKTLILTFGLFITLNIQAQSAYWIGNTPITAQEADMRTNPSNPNYNPWWMPGDPISPSTNPHFLPILTNSTTNTVVNYTTNSANNFVVSGLFAPPKNMSLLPARGGKTNPPYPEYTDTTNSEIIARRNQIVEAIYCEFDRRYREAMRNKFIALQSRLPSDPMPPRILPWPLMNGRMMGTNGEELFARLRGIQEGGELPENFVADFVSKYSTCNEIEKALLKNIQNRINKLKETE
jgi:hypothetical protein